MTNPTDTPGVQNYIAKGRVMSGNEATHRSMMRQKRFDTIAVHGIYGMEAALENQGSILEPAFLSSAQHFEDSDHMEAAVAHLMPSWVYSRAANPTTHYLEETLAMLEGYGYDGQVSACVTSSGMGRSLWQPTHFSSSSPTRSTVVVARR